MITNPLVFAVGLAIIVNAAAKFPDLSLWGPQYLWEVAFQILGIFIVTLAIKATS